jgi:hypothetical protein
MLEMAETTRTAYSTGRRSFLTLVQDDTSREFNLSDARDAAASGSSEASDLRAE